MYSSMSYERNGLLGDSWGGDPPYNERLQSGAGMQASKRRNAGSNSKAARTRPTNNQLLYKAYFRWQHYPHKRSDLPSETEACASVTSAFLQVLATLHNAETRRTDRPRNVLQILSHNTRRTKVVELSSGTHRVADDLRRHCLTDGENGQYSTNLDRNRYGNDDQYLATVIRYDLEYLDLCPCLVDVEIIDAKAGNESTLVSCGPELCACNGGGVRRVPSQGNIPARSGSPVLAHIPAGGPSGSLADRPWQQPTASGERGASGKLYAPVPTHSRGVSHASGGSDLFDALLMAATGATEQAQAVSAGEPPVTSKLVGSGGGGIPRQRSRLWQAPGSTGEVDSLQNALEAWRADEEIASGQQTMESPFRRVPSRRRFPRRGSLSNIAAAADEVPPAQTTPSGAPGSMDVLAKREVSGEHAGGEAEMEPSVRSQEGDTEARPETGVVVGGREGANGDDAYERGVLRSVHRQSSAVNLASMSRLGKDAEIRRLQDELRALREDFKVMEQLLEATRTQQQGGEGSHSPVGSSMVDLRRELQDARETVQRLQVENEQLRHAAGQSGAHSPVLTPKEEVVAVGTPASHAGDKVVGEKRKAEGDDVEVELGDTKRRAGLPNGVHHA